MRLPGRRSGTLTDWPGGQTHDEVVCPAARFRSAAGAALLVRARREPPSSYPTTQGWAVDVNNTTMPRALRHLRGLRDPRATSCTATARSISQRRHGGAADNGCGRNKKVLGGGVRRTRPTSASASSRLYPLPEGLGELGSGHVAGRDDQPAPRGPLASTSSSSAGRSSTPDQGGQGTRPSTVPDARTGQHLLPDGDATARRGSSDDARRNVGVTLNSTFPWPRGWSGIENNTSDSRRGFQRLRRVRGNGSKPLTSSCP